MSNVTLFQFIDKSFIFYKSKTQFIYFLLSKQKNQEILIPISTKFQTRLPHIYIYISELPDVKLKNPEFKS